MAPRNLKPITREALKAFYADYPLPPIPRPEVECHVAAIDDLAREIAITGSKVSDRVGMEIPARIDDVFWRNRCFIEEINFNLIGISAHLGLDTSKCQSELLLGERRICTVQEHNTEAASKQIKQFLPQDIRGTLLQMKQTSGEKANKRAIDALIRGGGSIREKYDLYLKQQWARRESLAQMGQLSGVYKSLVKIIGGIPQVLLDFAKEINAKLGPMEEQRIKYGPDLYLATGMGIKLNVFTALWLEQLQSKGKGTPADPVGSSGRSGADTMAIVVAAVEFYLSHLLRCLEFLGSIFVKSPFFLDADAEPSVCSRLTSGAVDAPPCLEIVPEDSGLDLDAQAERTSAVRLKAGFAPLTSVSSAGHGAGMCGDRSASIASETWMSCDDNASWVEGCRNSFQGSRMSFPPGVDTPTIKHSGEVKTLSEVAAAAPLSKEPHAPVADTRQGQRKAGGATAERGCACFGNRKLQHT